MSTPNINNTNLAISTSNPLNSFASRNNLVDPNNHIAPVLKTKQKLTSGQQISKLSGKLSGSGAQTAMGALSSATDIASSFIDRDTTKNPTGYDQQQQIGNALMASGNPYAMAAGAAFKAVSAISEAVGGNTNMITKDQAKDVGISGAARMANNIAGILAPGAGVFLNKVEEGAKSHLIDEMSNAYGDSVADINQAQAMGGGKYLFGAKKIDAAIKEANRKNELLTNVNMTNTLRKQSDYGRDLAQQNMNRYAGTNYMDMRAGKHGMKIQSLEEIRLMLTNRKIESEDVQKFAEGGSILPVGQRHKTLHHMDQLGEQFEDLTRKGIPVVTVDESGDLTQVAEIECMEWTTSKSLTDEIETLWKDGSEEAMIECGKLVCEHLLRQTKDEGGILNE